MAGSSNSSSSKTLSASSLANMPSSSTALITTLALAPHEFLAPSTAIQDAALQLAKRYFDPLMIGGKGGLEKIYLDGFEVAQVWEQVRGIVEEVGKARQLQLTNGENTGKKRKVVTFAEVEEEEEEEEEDRSSSGIKSDGALSEDDEEAWEDEDDEDEAEEGDEEEEDLEEGGVQFDGDGDIDEELRGSDLEDMGADDDEGSGSEDESKELVVDKFGLNDGFFSIDDFNRQTELLELLDARGAPVGSDDEDDIDLHADPNELGSDSEEEDLSKALSKTPNGAEKDDFDEMNDDEDDDEDAMDLDKENDNANDIMYADFFAPPARKRSKPPKPKQSWRARASLPDQAEELSTVKSEMARVRRDLFEDEDDAEDSDSDVDMDGNSADPLSRRSTHQKRQATLIEQIRQLEVANVAKREWTLSGEAKARDRPLNSLLEEDLDFERAGKPVPVITQEVTENLEDMIKRRILSAQFDEVLKRRPDDISSSFRRGRVDLDDAKPSESLAQIYEKEYLAKTSDTPIPTADDEKTKKDEEEIAALFADVSRKLDALTNWHYTPKPAVPTLSIVADAPAISMEEAQPSAAQGGVAANVSMLAPQEIYKPGRDKAALPIGEGGGREIIGKSGAPISTREMTSEEKQRRRRREKQKIRKRNAAEGVNRGEVKAGSKKDVVDRLKRGNVTVIGKSGEKRTVDGVLVKEKEARGSKGSFLKL